MSFWPFPKTLLDELRAGLALGPGVELGSGEGVLRDRLASVDIHLIATDIAGACDLRLDASRLPFTGQSLGLVVAGNLLRHLAAPARRQLVGEAARVLVHGGRLLLLEDDPVARTPAEQNYRSTLDLLARVDERRGGAFDLAEVVDARPGELRETTFAGTLENQERPRQVLAPMDWLAAHGGIPSDELAARRTEVIEHGMEYGRFQACVLRRAERRLED